MATDNAGGRRVTAASTHARIKFVSMNAKLEIERIRSSYVQTLSRELLLTSRSRSEHDKAGRTSENCVSIRESDLMTQEPV